MAKFVMMGVKEYINELEKIGGEHTVGILKYAVYPGAAVVADAIKQEIHANHTDSGELAKSLTLSAMRNDNGYVNTKISFAGYDSAKKSKRFPNGVPNAVKAAVLESGTSKKSGTHFISKTVKRVTNAAEQAMADALDNKIKQIMEG